MEEINYLMTAPKKNGGGAAQPGGRAAVTKRPLQERFFWHGCSACLHVLPEAWADTIRPAKYVERLDGNAGCTERSGGIQAAQSGRRRFLDGRMKAGQNAGAGFVKASEFWVAPELEACFPKLSQPSPGPQLASLLLRQQPFREILILLLEEEAVGGRWLEDFLEGCYTDLNGLFLVGMKEPEDMGFYDWLYEQCGLPASFVQRFPCTDGKKTAVVDLRRRKRPPTGELSSGSLYLDFTSEKEKQRLLLGKRKDISCILARNYLDTAFKARYNAF